MLQNDDYFSKIKVVTRRPVTFSHPKVNVVVIDFSDDASFRSAISGSNAVFGAVGTTSKKVKGDRTAYRRVDYDIPVNAASFCAETGCSKFLLVSSVGACSSSANFYIKFKGEVEDRVREMNIASVSVFRPSMLLGKRNEFRFGELIGKVFSVPFAFLMPLKYRPVQASDVAEAMLAASKKNTPGFSIYHYGEIMELSGMKR